MNSELQAQSDVLVKAINDAATTAHQDAIMIAACLTLIFIVAVIALFKKP